MSGKKYREKEVFFFPVFFFPWEINGMESWSACCLQNRKAGIFTLMIRCDRRSPMASIFGADSGGEGSRKFCKRRPILKIDTFKLDLFSLRSYCETSQQQVTQEFKFLDLVDQKMEQKMDRAKTRQIADQTSTEQEKNKVDGGESQWHRSVLFKGQEAIALTDQFVAEMEKMKQMLGAIMDSFGKLNVIRQSSGGCFHLSRISQLNSNDFSTGAVPSAPRLSAYEYSEYSTYTYSESEQTRFSAKGIVNTQDGNEIDFLFEMEMARSFLREESFAWTETGVTLIDPLIVNAGVTTPQFSGVVFSFDLDLDGNLEDIQAPAWGTGFLALDKNKDGVINDGGELFGPSTGDGFGELAAYDLDKNFWIDENDAVFDELSLLGLDGNGEMHLTRIKDAGMGAIYLAGVDTAFDLKNKDNELLAKIKRSSIALNEDGSVSSVQEADWTA